MLWPWEASGEVTPGPPPPPPPGKAFSRLRCLRMLKSRVPFSSTAMSVACIAEATPVSGPAPFPRAPLVPYSAHRKPRQRLPPKRARREEPTREERPEADVGHALPTALRLPAPENQTLDTAARVGPKTRAGPSDSAKYGNTRVHGHLGPLRHSARSSEGTHPMSLPSRVNGQEGEEERVVIT